MRSIMDGAAVVCLFCLVSTALASRSDGAEALAAVAAAEASLDLLRSDCAHAALGEAGHDSDAALRSMSRCLGALQEHANEMRGRSRQNLGHSRRYAEDVKAVGAIAKRLAEDVKVSSELGLRSFDGRQHQELDSLIQRLTALRGAVAEDPPGPAGGKPCAEQEALEKMEDEIEELRTENSRLTRDRERGPSLQLQDSPAEAASEPAAEAAPEVREAVDRELVGEEAPSRSREELRAEPVGAAEDNGEEEARLVQEVTQQAAKVARISKELRALEGNGKQTAEDVQAEVLEKKAKAEVTAQQLKQQEETFAQAKDQFLKANNETEKQRQNTTHTEAEHRRDRAAYLRERQTLEGLQRQLEEAEGAAAKAQAARTSTEKRLKEDMDKLQGHLAGMDGLYGKLRAVQSQEEADVNQTAQSPEGVDGQEEGLWAMLRRSVVGA